MTLLLTIVSPVLKDTRQVTGTQQMMTIANADRGCALCQAPFFDLT